MGRTLGAQGEAVPALVHGLVRIGFGENGRIGFGFRIEEDKLGDRMMKILERVRVRTAAVIVAGAVVCGLIFAGRGVAAGGSEDVKVVDTVKAVFVAAAADDLGKFHAVTTKDFYAYDNGMRFDGDALIQAIQKQHAAGYVYEWNVTQPEVHVAGNMAWITYINKGMVKNPEGTHQVTWLESMVLEKKGGKWRIHFVHSTRAAG
jgi:ketosteroid isomerase-like protein